ncbi:MAG: hypothetical protein HOI23_07885 [Deltaproteobacteria bacterium]|jgi:hypothetical protein|nr:hypothetical protein [Deltaproteobacteria bacterium]MBT6436133.1 hypothetical protein [Deltaproteobacteria bacterium]
MRLSFALGLSLLLGALPAWADEFDFGEDFEEESGWSFPLRGSLGIGAGYQVGEPKQLVSLELLSTFVLEWSGSWGRLSGEGDVELNTAHWIEGRDDVAKEYALVAIPRSLSYSYAFEHVSVEVGQFMTVWSTGDLIPVLDILTAADTTEGFFARPEQYRMGQVGARVDAYLGKQTFSLVWHGWPQMNRVVDGNHPYSLTGGLEFEQKYVWDPSEIAGRWSLQTPGGSVAVMGGQVYDGNPVPEITFLNDMPVPTGEVGYIKYPFVGLALTQTMGSLLLKSEVSWSWDAMAMGLDEVSLLPRDMLKALVGLDYNHESFGTFMVESVLVFMPQDDSIAFEGQSGRESELQIQNAVMWSNQFFDDSLSIMVMGILLDGLDNRVLRASLDYKLLDDLIISGQGTVIDFEAANVMSPGAQITGWDRVDVNLKWAWDLAR